MQLHIATMLEVVGVIVGIILLGTIGTLVTPQRPAPSVSIERMDTAPDVVIDHAQEGYQLQTCVRDIAPRTVLSENASGTPEFIVLEGAPVTECFPGLDEFITEGSSGRAHKGEEGVLPVPSFGGDLSTSVVVLPPSTSTPMSSQSVVASSSDGFVMTKEDEKIALPQASSTSVTPIPSGGGGGSVPLVGVLPPVDRFDACRIQLFGATVPSTLTEDEQIAFETCLLGTGE